MSNLRLDIEEHGFLAAPDGSTVAHGRFEEYVDAVVDFAQRLPPRCHDARAAISRAARAFHGRHYELLSHGFVNEIERLEGGAPILRISHQPNLLCATNVLGLALAQKLAADAVEIRCGIRPVVLFVFVDHDQAGDRRFKSPLALRSGSDPVFSLAGGVARARRSEVACIQPSITEARLESWRGSLRQSALMGRDAIELAGEAVRSRRETAELFDAMFAEVTSLNAKYPRLTDFSEAWIARTLSDAWGLDVVCLSEVELIAENLIEIHEIIRSLRGDGKADNLVWRTCPQCCVAAPATISRVDGLTAEWHCSRCSVGGRNDLVTFEQVPTAAGFSVPKYLPRVALEDRMDLELYSAIGGASYAGGTEHIVHSRLQAHATGVRLPPEFIWDPKELVAASRRAGAKAEPWHSIGRGKMPELLYRSWSDDSVSYVARAFRTSRARFAQLDNKNNKRR